VLGLCFAIAVLPGPGTSMGGPARSPHNKILGVCKNCIVVLAYPYGIL